MKHFYTTIFILLLTLKVFSQTGIPCEGHTIHSFNIPKGEPCADFNGDTTDIVLTPVNTNGAYMVRWNFANGDELETSNVTDAQIGHFANKGIYNVSLTRYFNSPECSDVVKQEVKLYGYPGVTPVRVNINDNDCAPVLIPFKAFAEEPVRSDLRYTWNFGDKKDKRINQNIDSLENEVLHIYTKSTCGEKFTIGNESWDDVVMPYITSTNGCVEEANKTARLRIGDPISIFAPPVIDFEMTADSLVIDADSIHQMCTRGEWEFINKTKSGKGKGCIYDDFIWWRLEKLTGDSITGGTSKCESEDCDSLFMANIDTVRMHHLILSHHNSCGTSWDTLLINLRGKPQVHFVTENDINCYPSVLTFINRSSDDLEYYKWDFGDGSPIDSLQGFQDVEHRYIDKGEYLVSLLSEDKYCTNSYDSLFVFEELCKDLFVPNAFIPESPDERFQQFRPLAYNLVSYSMEVYYLSGQLIWSSTEIVDGQPLHGWNGKDNGQDCPTGTYMWKLQATFIDGMGFTREWEGQYDENKKKRKMGTLTLVR